MTRWDASKRILIRSVAAAAVLSSLTRPLPAQFSGESAATVVTATGRVSVIRDDTEWALFSGQSVRAGERIVTGKDGFAELHVSDGSMFFVFADSQVVFRKNPGSLKDLLDIFLGKVKVHIQRLGGRPNRNRIFTPTAVISVRGTTFDVEVDENQTTVIFVDEGLVTVAHRLLPSTSEISVEAGQSLVVYRDTPLAQVGVDQVRAASTTGDMARTLAYVWSRIGRRGSGGAAPGGPAAAPPLPGDEQAPDPPPAPPR